MSPLDCGFIAITSIGALGVLVSTYLEWKRREPVWALLMKIFPTLMALGVILYCFD